MNNRFAPELPSPRRTVVIAGTSHISDRAWECRDVMEARRMVRWLRDNGIDCSTMTTKEINELL